MKKIIRQYFWILIISLTALSCDKNGIFEEYHTIPNSIWNKDSLITFDIQIEDTTNDHNLYINVRNEVTYNFSNLWLFIEIIQPDNKVTKDTFEITLADQTGKWLGDGIGGLKDNQVIYKRNIYFPVQGNYQIKIQQGMRQDNLPGISDVGVRLEKIQ